MLLQTLIKLSETAVLALDIIGFSTSHIHTWWDHKFCHTFQGHYKNCSTVEAREYFVRIKQENKRFSEDAAATGGGTILHGK